jgi:hypothetical protein
MEKRGMTNSARDDFDHSLRVSQFFLGLEVGVEAALAHPDLGGQFADRQAIQPLGGQPRRGVQDGGPTGLALRGAGLVADPVGLGGVAWLVAA